MTKQRTMILLLLLGFTIGGQSQDAAGEIPQLTQQRADLKQAVEEQKERVEADRQRAIQLLAPKLKKKTQFMASFDPSQATIRLESKHAGETIEVFVKGKGKNKNGTSAATIKARRR